MRNKRYPGDDDDEEAIEQEAEEARRLFDALDELEEPHRGLFIVHKIYGYGLDMIAAKLGLTESVVEQLLWRACAELYKKLRRDEWIGPRSEIVDPARIVISTVFCAAFCAIWDVEKRLPTFHGIMPPELNRSET